MHLACWSPSSVAGDEPGDAAAWLNTLSEPAQRGYRHLTESIYLPADLDEDVFAALVQSTDANSPALADVRTPAELGDQRAATFLKYGLTE
ncbi:MAG: hypothetical protein ACTHK7_07420, partial [Aureliella sp.]